MRTLQPSSWFTRGQSWVNSQPDNYRRESSSDKCKSHFVSRDALLHSIILYNPIPCHAIQCHTWGEPMNDSNQPPIQPYLPFANNSPYPSKYYLTSQWRLLKPNLFRRTNILVKSSYRTAGSQAG